jgi:hypothetical protein
MVVSPNEEDTKKVSVRVVKVLGLKFTLREDVLCGLLDVQMEKDEIEHPFLLSGCKVMDGFGDMMVISFGLLEHVLCNYVRKMSQTLSISPYQCIN